MSVADVDGAERYEERKRESWLPMASFVLSFPQFKIFGMEGEKAAAKFGNRFSTPQGKKLPLPAANLRLRFLYRSACGERGGSWRIPEAGRANQRRRTRALRNSMSVPWKGVEWNRPNATVAAGQCGTAFLARAGCGGPCTVLTGCGTPLAKEWNRSYPSKALLFHSYPRQRWTALARMCTRLLDMQDLDVDGAIPFHDKCFSWFSRLGTGEWRSSILSDTSHFHNARPSESKSSK